jgi:trans-aconitate methyltransferase
MQHTSCKSFGPIRNAYAFFQQHATETEADIGAYLPHLLAVTTGGQPIRMLDFGCGDGAFTAALLAHAAWLPARLQLALVEPDDVYRHQAVARLQAYTSQPVRAWPALPSPLHACFDLVLANHVLYFVPELDSTLAALLGTLASSGLFLTAMAGQRSTFAQWCQQCFTWLGQPYPYHSAEGLEGALARQEVGYSREDVHYELIFPDTVEHRLTVMRFLLGNAYHDLSQPALLALFDPYVQNGQVAMRLVHEHFMVWRHAAGGGTPQP